MFGMPIRLKVGLAKVLRNLRSRVKPANMKSQWVHFTNWPPRRLRQASGATLAACLPGVEDVKTQPRRPALRRGQVPLQGSHPPGIARTAQPSPACVELLHRYLQKTLHDQLLADSAVFRKATLNPVISEIKSTVSDHHNGQELTSQPGSTFVRPAP